MHAWLLLLGQVCSPVRTLVFGCCNSAARFRPVPLAGLVPSPLLPLESPIGLGLADFAWASHGRLQNQSGVPWTVSGYVAKDSTSVALDVTLALTLSPTCFRHKLFWLGIIPTLKLPSVTTLEWRLGKIGPHYIPSLGFLEAGLD